MAQVEALRAENERVQREIADAIASPASKRRSGAAAVASPEVSAAAAEAPTPSPTSHSTEAAGARAWDQVTCSYRESTVVWRW